MGIGILEPKVRIPQTSMQRNVARMSLSITQSNLVLETMLHLGSVPFPPLYTMWFDDDDDDNGAAPDPVTDPNDVGDDIGERIGEHSASDDAAV